MRLPSSESNSFNDSATCFYCNDWLGDEIIEWHGHHSNAPQLHAIAMHPACAVELCIRILRDAHQYECQTHRKIKLE